MIQPSRRRFLQTLTGIIAAPAIVKADSLMRIVAPAPYGRSPLMYTLADYAKLLEVEQRRLDWLIINPPLDSWLQPMIHTRYTDPLILLNDIKWNTK